MTIQPIRFQLSEKTIKYIEKSTRCSFEEIKTNTLTDIEGLMIKRGALNPHNKVKEWIADKYRKFGEKMGLLRKGYNIYTDVD